MIRGGKAVRIGAMLAAVFLLSACTTPEPEVQQPEPEPVPTEPPAPTGLAVGIVLPPASQLDPSVVDEWLDVSALEEELAPEIRTIRTYVPEDPSFVQDLVLMLADRGTDVICALGTEGAAAVEIAAGLHPELDYCSAPVVDAAALRPGIGGLEIRGSELGHVVGVAARELAAGGTVGLVLGDRPSLTPGFREGLLAGLAGSDVVEPADDQADAEAAVDALRDAGADAIVVDLGTRSSVAVDAVDGAAHVLAPAGVVAELDDPDALTMSWRVNWGEVFLGPVLRRLGGAPPLPNAVGFAHGAFETDVAAAAPSGVHAVVREVIGELVSGERDPTVAAPTAPLGPPAASTLEGPEGGTAPDDSVSNGPANTTAADDGSSARGGER